MQVIAAGKSVYVEKPLATNLQDGRRMVAAATAAGVGLGCAPDTVLGTGIATARHAIDQGKIGQPLSATATMMCPGHERWHPNPDFYYQEGGGPLLDMGPYYISALVTLLGPVQSVTAMSSRARDTRLIGSGPRAGEVIPVSVDTHVTGVLRHVSGALSTITMSFDAVGTVAEPIEVHGSAGSLRVPDPNRFDGAVRLKELGEPDWIVLEPSAGYPNAGRGVGLLSMVDGADGEASGKLGLHVLDVMLTMLEAGSVKRELAVISQPSSRD